MAAQSVLEISLRGTGNRQACDAGMRIRCCALILATLVMIAAADSDDGRFIHALALINNPQNTFPATDRGTTAVRQFQPQTHGYSFFDAPPVAPQPDPISDSDTALQPLSSPISQASAPCEPCREAVCDICCSNCSPCDESSRRYAVDIGSVFLFRSRPDGQQLFVNPTATAQNINAASFGFGTALGIDAGLILYEQHNLIDLELRATWVDEWTDGLSRTFSGSTVRFETSPSVGTSGPRFGAVVYGSDYFSSEINIRFRPPQNRRRATYVVGYRMLNLDERLNGTFSDPAGALPDELIQVQTRNRLTGLQVGADSVLRSGCNWCTKLSVRTGLYTNSGSQNSRLISLATPPVTFPAGGASHDLAWHLELGLSGKWRLSSCANLFASYRMIYIDGLALAPGQFASTSFLSRTGFHDNGAVLLHGITAGLEFCY